jgi:elongation factor Ts
MNRADLSIGSLSFILMISDKNIIILRRKKVEISAQAVKELRELTNAGIMDCKRALTESEGDVKQAIAWLQERGLKKAEKVTGREAKQGLIESYIHSGRIGSLVELNCETDFVARTEDFKKLARDIALQVVSTAPSYISAEDIPAEEVEAKKADYPNIEKWYEEVALLNQPFVRDPKVSIGEMIVQAKATLGENIVVRRMMRYELGK